MTDGRELTAGASQPKSIRELASELPARTAAADNAGRESALRKKAGARRRAKKGGTAGSAPLVPFDRDEGFFCTYFRL
ncbi:hypothetical protein M493_14695 [Geobacillus genomosp. 3]|uniref:Uncharacterized protein n=1 Tax=Geobacillus genomosp. 3 TaxID=1921421 RepID=S5Z8M9_GEOG3|nr:hypothetical protein M493_14695 [Geobacillus genomosp. 3]